MADNLVAKKPRARAVVIDRGYLGFIDRVSKGRIYVGAIFFKGRHRMTKKKFRRASDAAAYAGRLVGRVNGVESGV